MNNDSLNVSFKTNPNPMWVYEIDNLKIIDVNESALNLYGYSRNEFLQLTLKDLRPDSEISKLEKELNKAYQHFNNAGIWLHKTKDGDSLYIRILSSPIEDNANQKLVVAQNVTEYYQTKARLEDEKELLSVLTQNLPGLFYVIDKNHTLLKWSKNLEEVTGYTSSEIKNRSILDFFFKGDRLKVQKAIGEAFSTGHSEVKAKIQDVNGEKITFYFTASTSQLYNKNVVVGLALNIDKQEKARKELVQEKSFTEMALDSLPGLFYVIDTEQNYIRVNNSFITSLGYSRKELDSMNPMDFYLEEDKKQMISAVQKAFNEGYATLISRVKTKSGRLPYFHLTGSHFSQNGKDFILGTGINITEQVKLEKMLEEAHSMARIGSWELDIVNKELTWSKVIKEIYEVESDFKPSYKNFLNFYIEGRGKNKIKELVNRAIEHGENYDTELEIITAKKNKKWVRSIGKAEFVEGKCVQLYGTIQDITDQKTLINKLETAQQIAGLGYWTFDIVKETNEWSSEVYNIWDWDSQKAPPNFEDFLKTIHPDDRHIFLIDIDKTFHEGEVLENEFRITTPKGTHKWIFQKITLQRNTAGIPVTLEGTLQDITERKLKEEEISDGIKEREILLQEIHHRVKNNLAMISGMVQLQALSIKDNKTINVLNDTKSRINSLKLLHEQLYKSESFSKIDVKNNVTQLIKNIVATISPSKEIQIKSTIDENIYLNINQAVPLSLIINELLTNSFKHAFPGENTGLIKLSIKRNANEITLIIEDNGIGFPSGFDFSSQSTLGHTLIKTLASQLKGNIDLISKNRGAKATLDFKIIENIKGSYSNMEI